VTFWKGKMSALLWTNGEMSMRNSAGNADLDEALSKMGVPPGAFPKANMNDPRVRPYENEDLARSWMRMHVSAIQRRGPSAAGRIKMPPGFQVSVTSRLASVELTLGKVPGVSPGNFEGLLKLSPKELDALLVPWWAKWKAE
jgi:hypothetical protein